MARSEHEMLYQLSAQLGSGFNSTFSKAQQQLAAMQKEMQALNKLQSNVSAYQKQQQSVETTKNKLAVLQQQYDNIQREIAETGTFSADLENKLLAKQQQIDKTSASLERQTQKLDAMGNALREAGINTDQLGTETDRLTAEMDELRQRQEEVAEEADNFGSKGAAAADAVASALAAAGITAMLKEIAEAYMECVEVSGNFEASMSNVEALSGATESELAQLNAMAQELGATTVFTAQEAADAMGYMAMAGWDASDMLGGISGVLQLAAASGEDLAMVSDIVTDSLSAFGLTAKDTAHFSDVLAAAATNSNTNVSIMGETFKMSASVAGALGYSIEDVAVAVGLMANSGVKGSIAGTALKNTFNGLLEGVTLTSDAFGEYEYSAIKADGTMKSFGSTIDELRVYFEQMTEAERVSNAMAIAGQRGYNGLLAILNATNEDYSSLTESINNCSGAAERMAAIKLDNLNGELEIMKSAWEGLQITLGNQFNSEIRGLYAIGAELLSLADQFIQKNPGLTKGIMAFVGVLGAATAALAGYAAITKVVIPLMGLFKSAIPGVGVIMAVSGGIAALTGMIVGMNEAAGDAAPSLKELTEAADAMQATIDDAKSAFGDTSAEVIAAASVADGYITKLEEMGDYASLSADEQLKYKDTLQLLCSVVPELADQIDVENGIIEGGTAALRENTEAWRENAIAQAYQTQLTSMLEGYAAAAVEAERNRIALTNAEIKAEQAATGMDTAYAGLLAELGMTEEQFKSYYHTVEDVPYRAVSEEAAALRAEYIRQKNALGTAEDEIRVYTAATEESAEAAAEADAEIAAAKEAIENLTGALESGAEASAENSAEMDALTEHAAELEAQITDLETAYLEAYAAAYESISGQYSLWDTAAEVVATSADAINTALESQASYWSDYNTNLQSLGERAGEIDGLREVISSFADGSAESVNAVAGMATATDEELAAMVANWQALQKEQENVAGSIAEIKTNFANEMDALQQAMAEDIEAMKMVDEASAAGAETVAGFIDGALGSYDSVVAAFGSLGAAAVNALGMSSGLGPKPARYASGTDYADRGWAWVGEEGPELLFMNGGERVLPADVSRAVASEGGSFAPPPVSVVFQIGGDVTEGAVEGLQAYGEEVEETVRKVIYEIMSDAPRRSYA